MFFFSCDIYLSHDSSIVMQDTKTEGGANTVKLCFLILSCIAEDQYANSLMHDISLTFKVHLHRMPMRHRKITADRAALSQPLASTLLGEIISYIGWLLFNWDAVATFVAMFSLFININYYRFACGIHNESHDEKIPNGIICLMHRSRT